jgi:hypothetical protein
MGEAVKRMMTEEQKIRGAWEVYLYARDLLAQRMSHGMVAQSMLLISFSTLAIGRATGGFFVAFFHCVIAVLGVIYSAYLCLRVREIHKKLRFLEEEYFISDDLVFVKFLRATSGRYTSREFSQMAIVVVFLTSWLILLLGTLFLAPS